MSNVRSRQTHWVCALRLVRGEGHRLALGRSQTQFQQPAGTSRESGHAHNTSSRSHRYLGRPSVGGRLTAGAARHAAKAMQSRRAAHRTCSRRRCAGERQLSSLSCRGRCRHRITVLRTSLCIAQTRAMRSVPSSATDAEQFAAMGLAVALVHISAPAPNPSIERTSQSPLRALCAAAHVKR